MPLSRQALRRQEVRRHQGPAHGLHRRGRRQRPGHRVPARQPHLVLPVAQHHAPLRRARPARRLRPDRHGRQRQARRTPAPTATPTPSSATICSRCGTSLALGDRIVLVIHDWGSALGFEWARRNPERVAGIAYMEAIVTPVTWADWPENARRVFQGFRSPAGEDMVLAKNIFVERVLPGSILRKLARRGDGRIPPPLRHTPARTAAPR